VNDNHFKAAGLGITQQLSQVGTPIIATGKTSVLIDMNQLPTPTGGKLANECLLSFQTVAVFSLIVRRDSNVTNNVHRLTPPLCN
jgi:hypothetical protein